MSSEHLRRQTEAWSERLAGQIVVPNPQSEHNTISHDTLPEQRRICPPGTMMTRDFHEDRLNVHTDKDGKVSHVTFG